MKLTIKEMLYDLVIAHPWDWVVVFIFLFFGFVFWTIIGMLWELIKLYVN